MILFYIGLAIIFIGLGSVAWLLFTERKNRQPVEEEDVQPIPKETTSQLLSRVGLADEVVTGMDQPPQKKNMFSGLLNKFQKNDSASDDIAIIETEPRMRITKDILQTGTASVRINPVPESTMEPTPPIPQISPTHDKMNILLNEKTEALEKAERALAIELKNRKEFNKIKDLLEKELKDDKVKYRDLQIQIGTAQMDATNYKNRANQLELKVSKLEKTVTDLEHQNKEKDEKIFDREAKLRELAEKLNQNLAPEPKIIPESPPKPSGEEATSLKLPPDILVTSPEPTEIPLESAPQEKAEPDLNNPTQ